MERILIVPRRYKIIGQILFGLILSSPSLVFWFEAIWDSKTYLGDKLLFTSGVLSPMFFVTCVVLAIIKPRHPEILVASALNSTPVLVIVYFVILKVGF